MGQFLLLKVCFESHEARAIRRTIGLTVFLYQRDREIIALGRADPAAMGWHDSHLHAFDIDGRQYGDRHIIDVVVEEHRLTLNGLVKSGIARFAYSYDFGAN